MLVNQRLLIDRDRFLMFLKRLIFVLHRANLAELIIAITVLDFRQGFVSHKDQTRFDVVKLWEYFIKLANKHLHKFKQILLQRM